VERGAPAGAAVTLAELRSFCDERIAGSKTPRSMELVDALRRAPFGWWIAFLEAGQVSNTSWRGGVTR
jgi:hypothetical protein